MIINLYLLKWNYRQPEPSNKWNISDFQHPALKYRSQKCCPDKKFWVDFSLLVKIIFCEKATNLKRKNLPLPLLTLLRSNYESCFHQFFSQIFRDFYEFFKGSKLRGEFVFLIICSKLRNIGENRIRRSDFSLQKNGPELKTSQLVLKYLELLHEFFHWSRLRFRKLDISRIKKDSVWKYRCWIFNSVLIMST